MTTMCKDKEVVKRAQSSLRAESKGYKSYHANVLIRSSFT